MERGDRGCRFDELHSWIIDNIAKKIDIGILARQMNMTPRTFARLYRCHAGDTPANVVRRFRIEQARMVLENTAVPISTVARRCGFGDTETMRRAFAKSLGVAPVDYRKRFSDAVA